MASKTASEKVQPYVALAREYHRTGDVVLRRQAEENIREVAPTLAYAEKVIAEMYRDVVRA